MARDGSEVFTRMMEARFVEFAEALEKVIRGFGVGADASQRTTLVTELAARLEPIFENLAPGDRPQWLTAIRNAAKNYRDDPQPDYGFKLLKAITEHHHGIKRIGVAANGDYAFDSVYERLRDAENVPELFDRLVREISAIIDSGLVEEIAAQRALEEIIAALKANRKGSWWATLYTSQYVRWGWRFARESLKRIPGLNEAIVATEQTLAEEEEAIERVRKGLEVEAYKALIEIAPQIKRLADKIPDAPRLPSPKTQVETIEDVDFEVKAIGQSAKAS